MVDGDITVARITEIVPMNGLLLVLFPILFVLVLDSIYISILIFLIQADQINLKTDIIKEPY